MQCENSRIFVQIRFYVKSIFEILEYWVLVFWEVQYNFAHINSVIFLLFFQIFFCKTGPTLYQIWHESTSPTNFQPQMNISHAPTRSFSRPLINSVFIIRIKSKLKPRFITESNTWFHVNFEWIDISLLNNVFLLSTKQCRNVRIVKPIFTWNQFWYNSNNSNGLWSWF